MENNELSMEDLKEVAYKIAEEEIKDNNIKFNCYPLTNKEFYSNDIIKKNIINKFLLLCRAGGYNSLKGDVVIFLSNYKKLKGAEKQLFGVVNACYHEVRHSK